MRANLHLRNIDSACDQLYRHHLKAEDYDATKENWREEKMALITNQLPILINTITSNSIPCTEINTNIVERKVNALQHLFPKDRGLVSPAGANEECAAAVETNHINLAQDLTKVKEPGETKLLTTMSPVKTIATTTLKK